MKLKQNPKDSMLIKTAAIALKVLHYLQIQVVALNCASYFVHQVLLSLVQP